MRRKIYLIIQAFLLLATKPAIAQQQGKLSGKITDPANAPLAAVTVSLLKSKDSSLVKASVTIY